MTDKSKRLSQKVYPLLKKRSFIQCSDKIDEFNNDIDVVTPFDECKIVDHGENDFDKNFTTFGSDTESSSDSEKECKTDKLSRSITKSLAQFIHDNGFGPKASNMKIRLSGSISGNGTPRTAINLNSNSTPRSILDSPKSSRESGSLTASDTSDTKPSSPYNCPITPLTGRITDISADEHILMISIQQD